MRKLSLGAVSISALMLATAACGNADNNTYESAEVETADEDANRTAYNDDDASAYNDNRTTDASNANAAADASRYAAPTTGTAGETSAYDTGSAQYDTAAAEMNRSRSDIESLASRAFESADSDNNGVLDRDEYVQLALASARDFDTFITEPVKLMSVTPVTNPETMANDEFGNDTVGSAGSDPAMGDTSVGATQSTSVTLDAQEEADIQTAAGESFNDAAGGDDELTAAQLRALFLARFDEADQDGDDELNAAELRTFAELTRGQ